MSLSAWQTFVIVCRRGSLSAAAAELGYTQSAVSRQVAALERAVGVPLLERRPRGVVPTEAGKAFERHAVVVVNEADRAMRVARAGTSRVLRLGATPSLAAALVPVAMRRLLDTREPLSWSLVPGLTQELSGRLRGGELDLAAVTDAPPGLPDDGLTHELLGTDRMVVIVPRGHEIAGRGTVGIVDLAEETWVEDNDGSAWMIRQHAARAGVVLRLDLHAADLAGKVAMVAAGHGVAIVPGSLASTLRPDLVPVQLADAPTRGIYALLPRSGQHPATAHLLAELRRGAGHDPALDGPQSGTRRASTRDSAVSPSPSRARRRVPSGRRPRRRPRASRRA